MIPKYKKFNFKKPDLEPPDLEKNTLGGKPLESESKTQDTLKKEAFHEDGSKKTDDKIKVQAISLNSGLEENTAEIKKTNENSNIQNDQEVSLTQVDVKINTLTNNRSRAGNKVENKFQPKTELATENLKSIENEHFFKENPFEQEQWFSELVALDDGVQALCKKSFQTFKKQHSKPSFFAITKNKYISFVHFITKNAIIATVFMLMTLTVVSASAAELFAPNEYKPTTFASNLFSNNKQIEKDPYTALKPDQNNDVVSFDGCDLAIKYPKKVSDIEIKTEYSGNQNFVPAGTTPDSVNPDFNINGGFTNNKTVYIMPQVTKANIYEASVSCQTPGHLTQKVSKSEYEEIVKFEGWEKVEKSVIQEKLGWFVTQAEITNIYQRQVDANFIVRFIYNNQEYTVGYTENNKQLLEQMKKNGGQSFENAEGIFGNQIQLQFNSLVKSEINQQIAEQSQSFNSSSSENSQSSNSETQKFVGKIGNREIEMQLSFKQDKITGNYFYNDFKTPIQLKSNNQDSTKTIILEESNEGKKTGEFQFEPPVDKDFSKGFKGLWKNNETGRQYDFEVNKMVPNKSENTENTEISEVMTLKLKVYRKTKDKIYFVDGTIIPVYYRSKDLSKFNNFNEGQEVLMTFKSKNLTSPEKFYSGIKDYTVDVTKEILEITKIEKIDIKPPDVIQKTPDQVFQILQPKNARNLRKEVVTEKYCDSVVTGLNAYTTGNFDSYNYGDKFGFFSHKNLLKESPDGYQNVVDLVNGRRNYPTGNSDGDWYDYNQPFISSCSGFYSYQYLDAPQINLPGADRSKVFYTLEGQGERGTPTVRIFAYKGDNLVMLSTSPVSASVENLQGVADSCGFRGDFDPGCYKAKISSPEIKQELDKAAKELAQAFAIN